MRWRVSRRTVGYGRLYRGRFKSFPVQKDAFSECAPVRGSQRPDRRPGQTRRAVALEHTFRREGRPKTEKSNARELKN
jgi:hypothetical protein